MGLTKAKARRPTVSVRQAGGDNEVERDGNGRPRILVDCVACDGTGKIRSTKREGRLNKCLKCSGEGERKESFTRVTTFIDALEDKESLMTWEGRMVLLGVAMDTGFLRGVLEMDPEDKDDKDQLNRRAEAAKELAGANKKSEAGTRLHGYSEIVDTEGMDGLPLDIDPDEFLQTLGYADATQPIFSIHLMEQLVVNDEFRTAGTPDRVSVPRFDLIAPDGEVIGPDQKLITDLKTGRIDYGALKMAMQLALYSRSKLYNKATGERTEIPSVNQNWGLIMHSPLGSTTTTLYWTDLRLGWEAVGVAKLVRDLRSRGRKALQIFSQQAPNLSGS